MTKRTDGERDHSRLVADLSARLVRAGLAGASQEEVVGLYCSGLAEGGIPLMRVHVAQRAFHPVYGSIGISWNRDAGLAGERYLRASTSRQQWRASPFYHMMKEAIPEFREDLAAGKPLRFPILEDLRGSGGTDYFAAALAFGQSPENGRMDPIDPPEGLVMSWTSDAEGGFGAGDIDVFRKLLPILGLALKTAANRQMASDLMTTYLGTDAGRRVLSGEIQRGSIETIQAVIWYFDLQGFTRLTETYPGETVVDMLNAYFGVVVDAVEAHQGNVLKFMGDGVLAIFRDHHGHQAPRCAIAATTQLRRALDDLARARRSDGLPATGFTLAIHSGNVLYGNIGAPQRLDFTIIGAAVNITSRILGMCRVLERDVIISGEVAQRVMQGRDDIVSLGRYLLRGVPNPMELYTLHTPQGPR